jgi:hypothetical protein
MFGRGKKKEEQKVPEIDPAVLEQQRKDYAEYDAKRKKEQEERNRLQKIYNETKSICLTCQNAFVYEYLAGPNPDPLYLRCKVIPKFVPEASEIARYPESSDRGWLRKCTKCSEYKSIK